MDDLVSDLEKQVADLARSLRSVEARVAALEGANAPSLPLQVAAPVPAPGQASVPPAATEPAIPSIAALAGRCLFVLAGAFLVRALTDSGAFPRGAGVALGLAYALIWLVLADRAGRAGSAAAATAWGVTALVIACPLVWEASTRFGVLRPTAAAAVLFAVAAAALGASVHRNLSALAWVAVLSVIPTACLLLVTTHALVTFGALLVVLAAGAWAASIRRGWAGLPWLPAVVADLVVLEAVWIAARPEGLPEAYAGLSRGAVLALALALFAVSLAGTVRRVLGRAGTPDAFEAIQVGAAFFSWSSPSRGSLPWQAFRPRSSGALPDSRRPSRRPASSARSLRRMAPSCSSWRRSRQGWPGSSVTPFSARTSPGCRPPDSLVVLALSAVATAVLAGRARAGAGGPAARGAMFALACVSIAGAGALAVLGLALVVAPDGEPGRVAAARGAVLAAASVLLASLRRLPTLAPLARLTYPVLAIAGLKLLIDDLPHGRPSTLVATFVVYGAALIACPGFCGRRAHKTPWANPLGG